MKSRFLLEMLALAKNASLFIAHSTAAYPNYTWSSILSNNFIHNRFFSQKNAAVEDSPQALVFIIQQLELLPVQLETASPGA